jgi:hypothetical protein
MRLIPAYIQVRALAAVLFGGFVGVVAARAEEIIKTPALAVSPQYSTTHVYIAPADFDRFVASILATFGGT